MTQCTGCGRELTASEGGDLVASISGSIMGDEYSDTYFLCPACGMYTVEAGHDRFLGDEDSTASGPLSPEVAGPRIEIIRRCSRPWDKKCRCRAHREYFGPSLD